MTTHASAPGKLVLLGEYVVREGAPAMVAAIDRRARAQVRAQARSSLDAPDVGIVGAPFELDLAGAVRFADARLDARPDLALFRHAVQAAHAFARRHGQVLPACHVALDTAGFVAASGGAKLGLGSSAALTCALLAALLGEAKLLGHADPAQHEGRQAFLRLALETHRATQGGGSGIDVAASVMGGVCRFARPKNATASPVSVQALAGATDLHLVAAWSGAPASTPHMLSRVDAFKARDPAAFWAIFENLAILASAGCEFLSLRDQRAFLTVIPGFYRAMVDLGDAAGADIVTAEHRRMHAAVAACGQVYKPSGAGGGDMGVAFCDARARCRKVRQALERGGHVVVPLQIDASGVRVDVARSETI